MKTNADIFYTVDDVAAMLNISKSSAYKKVKKLNDELKEMHFITFAGRISRKYFHERCYCDVSVHKRQSSGKKT